jgi:short-subunit dehydrogenase involved in D-alanine esterification of teichoic acids
MPLLDSIAVDHLADAVLVITGGTNGIGLALAKRLLSLEGRVKGVVICSRSQENVDKAVKEM